MTPQYPDGQATVQPRVALFAGSFDPFTIGHASIVERAMPLFDCIVIAVGVNADKVSDADAMGRVRTIEKIYAKAPAGRIRVICYSKLLTVDLARQVGARWLLRGVRSVRDFEYERDMADLNRRLSGIETVLLAALPELAAISSSAVRELQSYGTDVTSFLPKQ